VHTWAGTSRTPRYTHQIVFDLREDDVYACVADVGWITGHSYIVYGPLANGATTLMFESVPTYPDAGRYWDMVERHRITIFYTAPTALRALAAQGDPYVTRTIARRCGCSAPSASRSTPTRGAGTTTWSARALHVVDTWWQTETGGIAISPLAPATPTKPGSATLPLPGICRC
jgi:acetyl-CoA synthetase